MSIKKGILLRVRLAFLVIFLFSMAIVWKLLDIQYGSGKHWKEISERRNVRLRKIKATRGNIYDAHNHLLATSLPFYKLAFDPSTVDSVTFYGGIDSLSYKLSTFFKDKNPTQYKNMLKDARKEHRQYIRLNRDLVNYHDKKDMESWPVFRRGQLRGGVIFEKVEKRFIPFRPLASRTIGFINEDNRGAGLEYSFDQALAGQEGEALYQKIVGGGWKPLMIKEENKPVQGCDIITTLDIDIQDVTESALMDAMQSSDAEKGCAVVMEVKTGKIKAMANLSRREAKSGKVYYREVYNHAVGYGTDPGSTFKLASMMAYLEETGKNLDDSIETGDGVYEFYDQRMHDSKPGGYGKLAIGEAFELSSNIAVSKMIVEAFGKDLNSQQRFIDYLKDFKLNQVLDFQIKGEAKPNIKSTDDPTWSGITLPWMSIGYELQLSPLQILTFYNSVANNGKMMKPYIVEKIMASHEVKEEIKPQMIKDQVCSKNTLKKLQHMLEGVVENGTAKSIHTDKFKIAGKTGTAQKTKGGEYIKEYFASFAGYFPADNPKYSIIVCIDNPKNGVFYGGDLAAPVFRKIADRIYGMDIDLISHTKKENVNLKEGIFPVIRGGNYKDLATVCEELKVPHKKAPSQTEWVRTGISNDTLVWNEMKPEKGLVPDVRDLTLRDAIYNLEKAGMRVRFHGSGRVVSQSQLPGRRVIVGSTIEIELAN